MSSSTSPKHGPLLSSDLLAELLQIVAETSAVLDPEELLPTIAQELRRIVKYRILDIFLPDADGTLRPALVIGYSPELAATFRIRPGEGIVGAAAALKEPVFVPDVSKDPRYIPLFPGVVAELAIPLLHRGRLVGVLNIEGPDAQEFGPDGQNALRVLASHLAVAIDNARLHDELRRRDSHIQRELAIAQRVQHGLFPEETPLGPGWEASTHFQPAQELGGDLYDFYRIGEGLLGLAVGDVAGKGVPAALYGAFASGSVRARAFQGLAPSEILYRANRTFRRRGVEGLFCTLTFALFDFGARRVRLANSGLPYPLRYRARDGHCEPIEVAGLPLGAFDDARYDEADFPLEAGDVWVFYTDGISEAHNGHEAYGVTRLKRVVEQHALTAQELGERIMNDLARFMDGAEPSDDVTLVVMRIL